jgi:hypothetical protein
MHPADRHPHIANLRALDVFTAALRLYRREPARVAGAALALLLPPVALGISSGRVLDNLRDGPLEGRVVLALAAAAIAGMLTNLGTIFYAGVLDELVGSVIRDARRPSIGGAIRTLPIWALIGADLAVTMLVGLTSALAVVPGFLLMAMLGIVGPLVNIERLGPIAAMRRSLRLTARHLWLVVVVIAIPLGIEIAAHHWLLHVRHEADVLTEIALSVPLIVTVAAFVGLSEVELAYALLARDDGSSVARMVEASVSDEPSEPLTPPTA